MRRCSMSESRRSSSNLPCFSSTCCYGCGNATLLCFCGRRCRRGQCDLSRRSSPLELLSSGCIECGRYGFCSFFPNTIKDPERSSSFVTDSRVLICERLFDRLLHELDTSCCLDQRFCTWHTGFKDGVNMLKRVLANIDVLVLDAKP
jgi:hypothetical protein